MSSKCDMLEELKTLTHACVRIQYNYTHLTSAKDIECLNPQILEQQCHELMDKNKRQGFRIERSPTYWKEHPKDANKWC
ncbi:hypothetical protein LOK49_LG02G01616 [Camellia lanceoleosa]|uniref:Uncharacterized protein n=1 Tax=Camellia lanceoleosa TaxID=1840588 RepID=A0ACC0IML6_9ERIC|nr:hypothetical protein LOK49_LG02G01616 [Camellia lanceoleosa]